MKAATIKKLPLVENYYCYMYSNPCMADTDLDSYDYWNITDKCME